MGESVQKILLWNANYDRENKDYTNALSYVHVVLNGVIFPQISYDIIIIILYCSICSRTSTRQVFFPKWLVE